MRRMAPGSLPGLPAWTIAVVLAVGGAQPASAAAFTLTSGGRISYGFDFGVFGVHGSLSGRSYSMTQTFALADLTSLDSSLPGADRQVGLFAASVASVTVNGATRSFAFGSTALNRVQLENGINPASGSAFGYDQIYTDQMETGGPLFMVVQHLINSQAEDILAGSGLDQTLSLRKAPGVNVFANASFTEFTGPGEAIGFYFTAGVDPIPAPPALGIFGAALTGLALFGRRPGQRR
jgi:hypothetical protein